MAEENSQWLVAICGLPGVGKSTVAEFVTESLDAVRLRTDVVRTELYDNPEYTTEERQSVYEELYEQAKSRLESGESVVVDATFAEQHHREAIEAVANEAAVRFQFLRVVCDQPVVERRITERDDISDADLPVYHRFKDEFDPIERDHTTVDNSESKEETRKQVEPLFPSQ